MGKYKFETDKAVVKTVDGKLCVVIPLDEVLADLAIEQKDLHDRLDELRKQFS